MSDTVTNTACPYCGSYWHQGVCPRIERIEYHLNGTIKAVVLREHRPVLERITGERDEDAL